MRILRLALFVTIGICRSQSAPEFEVASVKWSGAERDAANDRMEGGPGSGSPDRITWRVPLARLFSVAYGVDFDQISGPAWIGQERYTISAKLPAGATREQIPLMWQRLINDRFHLEFHRVQKEFRAYELAVVKGGHKLRQAGGSAVRTEPGFPEVPPGKVFRYSMVMPRNVRLTFRDASMGDLARLLGWPLSEYGIVTGVASGRVTDKTGLMGKYDFTLEYAGSWGPGGAFPPPLADGAVDTAPFLFDALRQQLGIQVRETRLLADVLVVDRAEKIPTEN